MNLNRSTEKITIALIFKINSVSNYFTLLQLVSMTLQSSNVILGYSLISEKIQTYNDCYEGITIWHCIIKTAPILVLIDFVGSAFEVNPSPLVCGFPHNLFAAIWYKAVKVT